MFSLLYYYGDLVFIVRNPQSMSPLALDHFLFYFKYFGWIGLDGSSRTRPII